MSEERFIYGSNEYWVKDNENNVELLPIDVLILLNEQQDTIKQLEGKIKRLNAFIVSKDLATEYLKWNRGYDE